ncbi:vWA domain-containing protein [Lysinibacillus telephonicus]|uniref:vWA domain-containing protein n=1 Tax=Lysinibacillus telephonicus TaxID=1714840 RepID=UPI003BA2B9B0
MRKVQWFVLLFFILSFFISPNSATTIYASEPSEVEIVFVIDTSYSMRTNDKERISAEVLNMFMDLNESTQTKIGFVFYNDKIVASQPLTSLEEGNAKSILRDLFNSIPRTGYTDPGLGLKKGQELFENNDEQTKKAIIFLTDGEIDLPQGSKRTKEQSQNDITKVIEKAKLDKYPIYSVGLGGAGNIGKKELEQIAVETGGSHFEAKDAEELPEIFQSIFVKLSPSTTLFPIATVTTNGKVQEVNIDVPYGMSEGTIALLSQHPIDETILYGQATLSEQHRSNHYTILKMKQITGKSISLNFKGVIGDLVQVSFLGNYDFLPSLELPEGELVKDEPLLIRTTLVKNGDNAPSKVTADLSGELIVKHLKTGTELRFPMNNTGSSFELEQAFSLPGTYEAKALIKGENFHIETQSKSFELIDSQPLILKSEPITINKWGEDTSINLSGYFSGPNQDKLTYEIKAIGDDKKITATINENLLTITPIEKGKTSIDILAVDQSGKSILSTLHISIESGWNPTYIMAGIAAGFICIGLITLWLVRKNYSFVGRIEGVFYHTVGKTFLSKKYWSLASFNSKKQLTLLELFSRLDIEETLIPGAERIVIQAGSNGVLTIKHDSKCIILKGGTLVPRNQKVSLRNNEKLFITFEDGKMEVELLYKAEEKHEILGQYSYSG